MLGHGNLARGYEIIKVENQPRYAGFCISSSFCNGVLFDVSMKIVFFRLCISGLVSVFHQEEMMMLCQLVALWVPFPCSNIWLSLKPRECHLPFRNSPPN